MSGNSEKKLPFRERYERMVNEATEAVRTFSCERCGSRTFAQVYQCYEYEVLDIENRRAWTRGPEESNSLGWKCHECNWEVPRHYHNDLTRACWRLL